MCKSEPLLRNSSFVNERNFLFIKYFFSDVFLTSISSRTKSLRLRIEQLRCNSESLHWNRPIKIFFSLIRILLKMLFALRYNFLKHQIRFSPPLFYFLYVYFAINTNANCHQWIQWFTRNVHALHSVQRLTYFEV